MSLQYEIALFPGEEPMLFRLSRLDSAAKDCGIEYYNTFKMSILLTDGMAAVTGNSISTLTRGDVVFFRPDEIHFGRLLRSGQHVFIDLLIPETFFSPLALNCRTVTHLFTDRSPDRVNCICPEPPLREKILRIAEELSTLPEPSGVPADDDAKLLILAKTLEILLLCGDAYTKQKTHPPRANIPAVVSNALQIIRDTCTDFHGLEELAARLGCSVTYLTRTFRKYTGKTVHESLTEQRLSVAIRLLAQGISVTDVCFRSGFGDCSNFIRIFKRYFRITPYQYAKRLCGETHEPKPD